MTTSLITTNSRLASSKLTTTHLARVAYVYIRQSSRGQVLNNHESTELQYKLVERAIQLGWPKERIKVIDEDLAKSAASMDSRLGFQHLLAEISLKRVGVVLSLEASRLARNNRAWYELLDLCSLFGALICDAEQLYDPATYHDRLLLGLSGMMSEAELHQLKQRLVAGARHKAERGELIRTLPIGLVRLNKEGNEVGLDPHEEVQARLHLVFDKFKELGSARAVLRYFQAAGLPLPVRGGSGGFPHPLSWNSVSYSALLSILKNPAYAGAYVYGRHRQTANHSLTFSEAQVGASAAQLLNEEWSICLLGRYPAYISWEQYVTNLQQLSNNQSHYSFQRSGVAKRGSALLQGIVRCGRCGSHMLLHYSGQHGQFPLYSCQRDRTQYGDPRCQEVRAIGLDNEVAQLFLAALAPDKLEIALASLGQLEQERASRHRQGQLRLERARYEAQRAERQYQAVEPENRLVARNLERTWEEKLRAWEVVEQQVHQAQQVEGPLVVSAAEQALILALGTDLPKVWYATTTTNAERKELVRLVIKEVVVDQNRRVGQIWFRVNWQTGASSEHWLVRRVQSYATHAFLAQLQARVQELVVAQKGDNEIAEVLNLEGFVTARGLPFRARLVWKLRQDWGIASVREREFDSTTQRWSDGSYTLLGIAQEFGVSTSTAKRWLLKGWLEGQQNGWERPWRIKLDQAQINQLRTYLAGVTRSKKEAL